MRRKGEYTAGKITQPRKCGLTDFPRICDGVPMEAINMPTPEWIKEAARTKGLTIAALCRRADMDTATYYRWANGDGSPTLGTIQKMLDAIAREPDRRGG